MSELDSKYWYQRAEKVIPGGVSSPVRSFKSVGGTPYFVEKGEGPFIFDIDGNRYVDYVQSYGAIIFGHSYRPTVEAISIAASNGTSFGAPTIGEVELAELICSYVPGCEMVRFVNSGTEAVMSALRVAKAYTGRNKVVLFEGCYHGHSDQVLAMPGSGSATLGLPRSAGVDPNAVLNTVVLSYNSPEIVLDKDVACVLVEPVAANMGLVPPKPGWLKQLRSACDMVGAVLIFDEVITGFRTNLGSVDSNFEVLPDMWCFGKVIGGGLPLACFGGSTEIMKTLAPIGPVYQAGTLSGNPIAVAAGLSVLRNLKKEYYEDLKKNVTFLVKELDQVIGQRGVAARVIQYETILGIFFGSGNVENFLQAKRSVSNGRYAKFFHYMLSKGIALAPGGYEIMFPSFSHGEKEIQKTIDAADEAAASLAQLEV
jgi:glutamate-1-semialdehyde 2,1-aminomutase